MGSRIFEAKQPYIAMGAFVDPTAVAIGDVEIGEDSSVWPRAVLRGDVHSVRVGARTNIQDGAILHVTHPTSANPNGYPLVIGDEATIGINAILKGCSVGNRCSIGMGVMILDGAAVGSDVMIAPGTIVPEGTTLEGGFLYAGTPVKKVREITAEEREYILVTSKQYLKLKDRYLIEFQKSRERQRTRNMRDRDEMPL